MEFVVVFVVVVAVVVVFDCMSLYVCMWTVFGIAFVLIDWWYWALYLSLLLPWS